MTQKPQRSIRLAEAVSLSQICAWLGLPVPVVAQKYSSQMVQGVSTDTRTLQPGDLFVALSGANHDAHALLAEVRASGAVGALVMAGHAALSAPSISGWPLLECQDTRQSLGMLALAWRQQYALTVVAVTGSNGKTTTKELVRHLLASAVGAEAVLSTLGNFNNDIGLPLTLLRLGPKHRYAVIEIGMSHPGEIAALAQLAQPQIAIVTNAQRAHLAGMGSLAGVAEEKGSLYGALPAGGAAIINGDDPYAAKWRTKVPAGCRTLITRFVDQAGEPGLPADFMVEVQSTTLRGQRLKITTPAGEVLVELPLTGRHNASNAAQAMAAGYAAGLDIAQMAVALAQFSGVAGRLQYRQTSTGVCVIDDTYNANPDSMRAAIDVLAAQSADVPTVFVMGDMGEIGASSEALHAEVGAYAAERKIGSLWAVGPMSKAAVAAFEAAGGVVARHFDTQEALIVALGLQLGVPAVVLVKGSRSSQMERVVNALTEQG